MPSRQWALGRPPRAARRPRTTMPCERGSPTAIEHVAHALFCSCSGALYLQRYDVAGDVITTGTPAGIAPMQIGDEVTVKVEGIGTLTNTLLARSE
jgi:hypothetical protein